MAYPSAVLKDGDRIVVHCAEGATPSGLEDGGVYYLDQVTHGTYAMFQFGSRERDRAVLWATAQLAVWPFIALRDALRS